MSIKELYIVKDIIRKYKELPAKMFESYLYGLENKLEHKVDNEIENHKER